MQEAMGNASWPLQTVHTVFASTRRQHAVLRALPCAPNCIRLPARRAQSFLAFSSKTSETRRETEGKAVGRAQSEETVNVSTRLLRSLPTFGAGFFQSIADLVQLKGITAGEVFETQKRSEWSVQVVEPKTSLFFTQSGGREDEIASVTEDEIDPSVLWEQRRKDVEAEKRRPSLMSPGFSFSAAGLLFPYHLGVSQCLIERGYITENTPLAGSSAGALVCAVIASGLSMQEAMLATKGLSDDCRVNGTAFRLGAVLREFLEEFLPDDAHIRANGRIRVAITQVFHSPRGLLVDNFDSKADLINALHTSCFVPGYIAPRPVTIYRNRICVDGGLTLFMPPTSAECTVRICAFPAAQFGLKGIGISPDCNPSPDRASSQQLLKWALQPAEDDVLENLFCLGYKDALVWTSQNIPSGIYDPISTHEKSMPTSSIS